MNFYLDIENNNDINHILCNLDITTIQKSKNILFRKYYNVVSIEKEKIDKLENSDSWDKMKKIGNPYELIYTSYNKKRRNDSISLYIPISRSYFKMWEIFYNFDFFKYFNIKEDNIFSHLAEGPGGFMEATYNYKCKMMNKIKLNDDVFYNITLKPTNNFIPDFNKIKKIFNDNTNIKVTYGNLYFIEDVMNYINNFSQNKASFVTADGGFDYSSNFNGQEVNSCQIIYSECIIALNILKYRGCFVCKVFDLFTITMVQMLYIVSQCFDNIYIYKPDTSRPANSEKYLICMYYKDNLDSELKNKLLKLIEKWQNMTESFTENDSIIFKNLHIDNNFIQQLNEYNEKYMDIQMFYLNNTINLAETKIDKEKYGEIVQNQVDNALKWCNKYNVEINKNSIYYKKSYI